MQQAFWIFSEYKKNKGAFENLLFFQICRAVWICAIFKFQLYFQIYKIKRLLFSVTWTLSDRERGSWREIQKEREANKYLYKNKVIWKVYLRQEMLLQK
jgi:hypothetical protein